jgi:hypothetical protein
MSFPLAAEPKWCAVWNMFEYYVLNKERYRGREDEEHVAATG